MGITVKARFLPHFNRMTKGLARYDDTEHLHFRSKRTRWRSLLTRAARSAHSFAKPE